MVEIDPWVLVVEIFKFRQSVIAVYNYLPLEIDMTLHLNEFEFPSSKDA